MMQRQDVSPFQLTCMTSLQIQNITAYLETCFETPDQCKSDVYAFRSAFGAYQLLREISGSLAFKRSATFTGKSLVRGLLQPKTIHTLPLRVCLCVCAQAYQ